MTEKDRSPHLPSPRTGSPTMADDGHNEIDAASTPWFSPDGLFSIRELLEAPNVQAPSHSAVQPILRSLFLEIIAIPCSHPFAWGRRDRLRHPATGPGTSRCGPVPADVIQYGVPDPESLVGVDLKERYISVSGEQKARHIQPLVSRFPVSNRRVQNQEATRQHTDVCPARRHGPQFSMASGAPASSGPGIAVEPLDDERGHEPLDDERGHEPSDDEHGPDWLHRDRDRAVAFGVPDSDADDLEPQASTLPLEPSLQRQSVESNVTLGHQHHIRLSDRTLPLQCSNAGCTAFIAPIVIDDCNDNLLIVAQKLRHFVAAPGWGCNGAKPPLVVVS
ncbi:hypothetical protein BKA70DRAFT_1241836 [Coprinopsis sp. MPI-PUGE-AT-0042]|nr:hypothetical protein BKA70DRAFT_1241836 [Coprinopsis sp. MPI-PUGE-AT-0042]